MIPRGPYQAVIMLIAHNDQHGRSERTPGICSLQSSELVDVLSARSGLAHVLRNVGPVIPEHHGILATILCMN